MEDDLSIFRVRIWTRHSKLGGVRLLRIFNTSLRWQDMTEDDLSIFRVRIWTRHGKLGGVRLLRIFDMSLRCRDMRGDNISIFRILAEKCHGACPDACPWCRLNPVGLEIGFKTMILLNLIYRVHLIYWVHPMVWVKSEVYPGKIGCTR